MLRVQMQSMEGFENLSKSKLFQRRFLIVLEYLTGQSVSDVIDYDISTNPKPDSVANQILNLDEDKFLEFLNSMMVCFRICL